MFRLSSKPSAAPPRETFLEEEEPAFTPAADDPPGMDPEPETPSRFFDQLIVCALCLILLLVGMKSGYPRFQWIRERIHSAVDASTEATFGVLGRSPILQGLIRTSKNLIKLEEITQPLGLDKGNGALTMPAATEKDALPGAVWPVNGNVTRGFGWQYNPASHAREFNSGIEITAQPGAVVHAFNDGEVMEIARQNGSGWQVSVNHGAGWISIYRDLGEVKVRIGQKVTAGSLLGSLQASDARNAQLWFEIKYEDRPLDPLTLFSA